MISITDEFTREAFLSSKWREATQNQERSDHALERGFSSLAQAYQNEENKPLAAMMTLLARVCGMALRPDSSSEPFQPSLKLSDRRSAGPGDLTKNDLTFFIAILDDIDDSLLKARLADLLWVCLKPKNINYARKAITAYTALPITAKTWIAGASGHWERVIKLCRQFKDQATFKTVETKLYAAFLLDDKDSPHLSWWIAELLEKTKLCRDKEIEVAKRLMDLGQGFTTQGEYLQARANLEIAQKIYYRNRQQYEQQWLNSLMRMAETHELEGDERLTRAKPSQMVANSFYQHALQAYREIPKQHRPQYDIDGKLAAIQSKITQTGKAALDQMLVIQTPSIDITYIVTGAQQHVSGKQSLEQALLYFTEFKIMPYESLEKCANDAFQQMFFANMSSSVHMAADGRTIVKVPPAGLQQGGESINQAALDKQIFDHFAITVQMTVYGQILPALDQLQLEYRISREFLESLCYHSPIVPENREKLMAYALWHGFEYDFANAIHLLSPQFEHLVRTQLKAAGAPTSTINPAGEEQENGLSTLMALPQCTQLFGKDTTFAIKALFTESLSFNLRNDVAHGLLDDNLAASVGSVYAWWLVLKLVVWSMLGASAADATTATANP